MQPGAVIVVGKADADVFATRHPGEVGETRQRVNGWRVGDELAPRAAVAHAGHLHVDDAAVAWADGVVADSPALQDADGEVVDHHVGLVAQTLGDGASLFVRHVQRQSALVAVPHDVVDAIGRVRPGANGGVHLHHVGAQVREDAGGERPRQDMGKVQDANAGERSRIGVRARRGRWRQFLLRGRCWARRERCLFAAGVGCSIRSVALAGADAPRRGAEVIGSAGAAQCLAVASRVGLPPAARLELWIQRHLVDRQDPAVGRVPPLRLEEQLLHVLLADPMPQYLHDAPDERAAVAGILIFGIQKILLRFLLDEPDQLAVEVWRWRHHDRAALGRHDHISVGPVQAAATRQRRPCGVRQPVVIPQPHQHVFQARCDAFVDRDMAGAAGAGLSAAIDCRQRADGHVGAREHEVQIAEQFERRRIDIAGGGDGAAQCAGHKVGRQVVAPWAFGAERRHFDDRQFRSLPAGFGECAVGDAEGTVVCEHDVRFVDQLRETPLIAFVRQIQGRPAAIAGEEEIPKR